MPCTATTPAELIVGQLDLPYIDKSEIRFDRMVGTISFRCYVSEVGAVPNPAVVRFGILAVEDTDRVYQTIDLWDPESVEEYEWMWIEQFSFPNQTPFTLGSEPPLTYIQHAMHDVKLDIRTRRKLGQKDSIVLYAQHREMGDGLNDNTITAVRYIHNMRAIAIV